MKQFLYNQALTEEIINRLDNYGFTPETLEEAIDEHKEGVMGSPMVYCGTYGKYNNGNLSGMWINLATFDCYDEFIEFCKAIHADEEDPELMFQDYEGFPEQWYCESCMGEETFDRILNYIHVCEDNDKEAVDAYLNNFREDIDLDNFNECYCGKYDSEEDYARELVNDCYDIDKMMGNLASYFDYEAFARDLFMTDYEFEDGYVFRR